MSRAYVVSQKETLTETKNIKDGLETKIDILPILPPEIMGELLLDSLVEKGYKKDPCGTSVTKEIDGVLIVVDGGGTVTAEIQEEVTVNTTITATGRSDEDYKDHHERAMSQINQKLEEQREQAKKIINDKIDEKRADITKTLEKVLATEKKNIDEAINDTTIKALKQKAAQLGEIISIEESGQDVTIRVKV